MEIEIASDACAQMTDELRCNVGDRSLKQQVKDVSGDQLDLEAYAALYSGRTKILRLLFIVEKCNDVSMQLKALRMAYEEIKKGDDTKLYREVVQKIDGRLGPDYDLDRSWIEMVDRKADQTKEKLQQQLQARGKRLAKKTRSSTHMDFGDFYYARGAFDDAFMNYTWTGEDCSNSKDSIPLDLNVILVCIEMGNFSYVLQCLHQATLLKNILSGSLFNAKLQCAGGLAYLKYKKYKHVALTFLEITPELGDSYSEVIATKDVATYGGLCALACLDRMELKTCVFENMKFLKFLEMVPKMRDLIHDFYSSRYASFVDSLVDLKPNLLLDIHLHEYVEILYTQIRTKAILQYLYPYSSVDMKLMATAFKTSVAELQKELEARIDSVNKVLYACQVNERNSAFQEVLETGSMIEQDLRARMLRFNLIKNTYEERA